MKQRVSKSARRDGTILIGRPLSLFLVVLVGYGAFIASSSTSTRESVSEQAGKTQKKLPPSQASRAQVSAKPNAPSAAGVTATLTDNTLQATKVAPGSTINYTSVITSTGGVGENATGVTFNAPLDANTTYTGGTVHASPIAFNDTYSWVGNTQLNTTARALPAVTANDIAVNATLPAVGTDTFNLVTQTNAPTTLAGGLVTLNADGSFVYTPPLGRPNLADGASVNDSFTYTITNSADPTLVGTGTVTITLTGRIWYLQAGAAGDGRSNTPSSSPAAMSTAADKSADIFYIFSNAGSLNGPFSLDAGQMLLGQGVNLIVNTITLFTAAAPTPTTTNTAGNAVTLAGAPGNNTLAGFNIGNSTGGTAIAGANVGTLNVSTMSINTNGGALDLTGVGFPTISVVLGGTSSTGGARNVSIVGLNGTVTLAGGALSGATGNALHVDGGNAGITYSGTISNSGARQVNIINKTGGTVALSGAIGGSGTGIFLNANPGATMNFTGGIALSTGANPAFTATGPGPAATSGGTVNVTQNNTTIVNTLTSSTGTALNVANTTIGASGVTFRSITSNGAANGIIVNNTGATAGLTVSGNGGTCASTATCTGGSIQTAATGVSLTNTLSPSFDRVFISGTTDSGINGTTVTNFSFTNGKIDNSGNTAFESNIAFNTAPTTASNIAGTLTVTGNTLTNAFYSCLDIQAGDGTITNANISNNVMTSTTSVATSQGFGININGVGTATTAFALNNATISSNTITNFPTASGIQINGGNANASGPRGTIGIPGDPANLVSITSNTIQGQSIANRMGGSAIIVAVIGGNNSSATTRSRANINISNNPTLTNVAGTVIGVACNGHTTMTATVTNNVVVANQQPNFGGANGIGGGCGIGGGGTAWVNALTMTVTGNNISQTDGNGILLVNRATNGTMDLKITGNTVGVPINAGGTARQGIRIDSGNATAGEDTAVCLRISGNTSAGSNGGAGIGIRKQGTVQATDEFGITGLAPSPATGAQAAAFVVTQNPAGGGCDNISGSNFQSCASAPAAPTKEVPDEGASVTDHSISSSNNENIAITSDPVSSSNRVQRDLTSHVASGKPVLEQYEGLARYAAWRTDELADQNFRSLIGSRDQTFASFRSGSTLSESAIPASYWVTTAVQKISPSAPQSGETLNVPLGTLPPGKIVTIKYSATVNVPPLATQVSTQGTVSGSNFASVLTNDPDSAPANDPTVTLINTLMTWNGVTSTDWNTATNWTPPAGGTQYAPGVSNPAVNDVAIPNVGNQPTIGTTDIGIFSLNISNGRTLSITSPRVLTIGGSPGGDLTLDGIISGGNLNLGTGTHVINNAGGTGSLSSTNVATVLSGSTVTLNNNLQAGAVAVNAGGSMIITNRTLSLNGSGAALVIPGGATFTTTGSTVVFNGTAAQEAAGIAYNNLTDANTAAALAINTNGSIAGTLTVNANAILTPAAAVIISGTGTLTGNGTAQVTRTAATADFASQYTIANKTLTNLTVEYIGAAAQIVSALPYGGLKISNAAGVTLAGNTTVNGLLNLAGGDITTAAFTLTQPSSAPASQGTGDVIGNTKRINGGVLPTGTALTFGNPNVRINFASVTALTDVNINLVKSAPGTFTTAVQRTYTITPTGGGTFSATLRLHYLDSELNGNTEGAGLKLFRFNGVSLWTPFANTGFDTTDNWAEVSGITLFSPWTLSSAAPTDVRLDTFAATGYDGGTLIEWRTGFEADNLGFNLYRDEAGKRVAVNSQLVAGSALRAGSGVTLRAGQSYAWWDGAASKSGAQYWLESIDLNGQSEWHGPFSSRFIGGGGPARANSSMLGRGESAQAGLTLSVERAALSKAAAPAQVAVQSGLAGQTTVKMWVKREGFYRVTASELSKAGLDPRADTRLLQLYADGQQIPINVIADKDGMLSAIEFYGRGMDAAFTDQRVYWLVSGSQPGLRIPQVKGEGQPTASQSFLYTAERKDRTIYFSGLRNGERENFFGAVIATSPVDQSLTLQHVDQSATGTATMEVALQGVTTLPHKVWVYLNGAFAGELSFEGQARAVSKFNVAQTLLRSGDNQVRFVAQAGSSDTSLVDYVRVSYWHSFTADDNALRLTTLGNQEVTIGGFSSGAIRVLDVTDPDAIQELGAKIEQQKTGFAVTVASPGAGERRLLALETTQSSKPAKISANQPSNLRTTAHGADLVMIAPRDFWTAIEPLRTLRSKQGLKVELADIEDVFDEFSFGNKSPQAMKDFLEYAATSWKIKPRFVLLVGDASYDAKNYLGLGDSDIVPTKLIDTSLMETASDDWLTDFNADGLADLAVGRLAARTPAEVSTMVRKIIGYDSGQPLESMLLVADVNTGFDFESASSQLRASIPGNLRVEQINRGELGDATAKSRLIDAITRGQKVVNYMGHGSVNMWSGSLLTNEEAASLTNGERLPVFVMMTCLNGYFHDPALDSLAESLLKAENGGAIAVWTSTGMTEPGDQSVLNKQLYQLLFGSSNGMTLGEATARTKASVTDGDIRRTWVLLGDPTMRLK